MRDVSERDGRVPAALAELHAAQAAAAQAIAQQVRTMLAAVSNNIVAAGLHRQSAPAAGQCAD